MFAYCGNNPVCLVDYNGKEPQWVKDAIKGLFGDVIEPLTSAARTLLGYVEGTFSTGFNFSGSPSFWSYNAQIGISIDTKGDIVCQASMAAGITTGTPTASFTKYASVTNAPSVDSLNGFSTMVGGSCAGFAGPLAVGGDFVFIPNQLKETTYLGGTVNVGVGLPGGELHVELGGTTTMNLFRFNLFDEIENFCGRVRRW